MNEKQVSLVSPILFLIHISKLFNNLQNIYLLFCIDEIALATISTSLKKNVKTKEMEANWLIDYFI